MNPAPIFDRVYADLRQRMRTGIWRPGQHIDLLGLAADLDASTTPVRDALNRLVGERLLATGLNDGFAMAQMTEPDLNDLYEWNRQLLLLAAPHWNAGQTQSEIPGPIAEDIAASTAAVFAATAGKANNLEHGAAVDTINARLHVARRLEAQLLDACELELAAIRDAMLEQRTTTLRQRLNAYHRRRSRIAGRVVQLLYRAELREAL